MADLGKLSLHREVKMSLIVRDDWQLAYCTKVVCMYMLHICIHKQKKNVQSKK